MGRHTTPYPQGETPIPSGRDSHTPGERHHIHWERCPHPLGDTPKSMGKDTLTYMGRDTPTPTGGQKPKTQEPHSVDPAAQGMSVEPNPVSPLQAYFFFLFRRQFHQHILSADTKSSIRKHHSGPTMRGGFARRQCWRHYLLKTTRPALC